MRRTRRSSRAATRAPTPKRSTKGVRQNKGGELALGRWLEVMRLPMGLASYRYPQRRFPGDKRRVWIADRAWPDVGLIVEVQGGIWVGGAHAHPLDLERNMLKSNDAALLGFRILQFAPEDVISGSCMATIEAFFNDPRLHRAVLLPSTGSAGP